MTWPADFPVVVLQAPDGACAHIALYGAQVLQWRSADGLERLYVSEQAVWDGSASIRAGVPVCWPQFNQRGPLAKHGFARRVYWEVAEQAAERVVLRLTPAQVPSTWTHDAQGQCLWPYAYELLLTVALQPNALHIQLDVHNTGDSTMPFTAALHSYLACDAVEQLQITGAEGLQYWDAVADANPSHPMQVGPITFCGEVDRVYPAFTATLQEPQRSLRVEASASMGDTVVWNPGAALAATLADIPAGGWRRYVCVEAAQLSQAVALPAGAHWSASQTLRAV